MPSLFDTRSCIFPVLLLTFKSSLEIKVGGVKDGLYLGTGFFMEVGSSVAFVTARHVIDIPLEPHQRIGIGNLNDDGKYWWDYFENHPTTDLAFARFKRKGLPAFVHPLPLLTSPAVLERGSSVYSFGFPFTNRAPAAHGKVVMTVEEILFSGYIATHYDREVLVGSLERPFAVNYALSFEVPRGLSGAPLLSLVGDRPQVCGVLYANRSIHFQVDEYEEVDQPGGQTVRTRVVRAHHLGLASTARELGEIPPL